MGESPSGIFLNFPNFSNFLNFKKMLAVVDYDTGNLRSVAEALNRLGAEFCITADHEKILRADRVLLPGVGEASSAMANLRERGLDELLPRLTCPVLGICIGMQLMCVSSEEGNADCMGIFSTKVRRLPNVGELKVPHVGWDSIAALRSPLFKDVSEGSYIYYVHSYAADLCAETIATTDYATAFSAALARDNFFGTQFHPEKSGGVGARILKNFLAL